MNKQKAFHSLFSSNLRKKSSVKVINGSISPNKKTEPRKLAPIFKLIKTNCLFNLKNKKKLQK